jgi:hypothetical protein
MNYYRYLKGNIVVYCISGFFLAFTLFGLISLHRYNDYLLSAQGNIKSIGVNKLMMKKQSAKISALETDLQRQFNLDLSSSNSDVLIFESLDSMRSRLKGARMVISKFKESGNEQSLPVEIDTYPASYSAILEHLHYIESFSLPDFKIQQLIIAGEHAGQVLLKIKGSFSMPSLKSQDSDMMREMP